MMLFELHSAKTYCLGSGVAPQPPNCTPQASKGVFGYLGWGCLNCTMTNRIVWVLGWRPNHPYNRKKSGRYKICCKFEEITPVYCKTNYCKIKPSCTGVTASEGSSHKGGCKHIQPQIHRQKIDSRLPLLISKSPLQVALAFMALAWGHLEAQGSW